MFALLEHDTSATDAPLDAREVHWDLIIEVPGRERLPTWRLTQNPLTTGADTSTTLAAGPSALLRAGGTGIPAARIQDHRPLYLDYEGEISGGRGGVRPLDRGPATVERLEDDRLIVILEGRALRGRFEIMPAPGGRMLFRRGPEPRPPDRPA